MINISQRINHLSFPNFSGSSTKLQKNPYGGQLYGAAIGSGRYGKYAGIIIGEGINSILAYGGAWDGSDYPAPIGNGIDDYGSGTVTIDGTTS